MSQAEIDTRTRGSGRDRVAEREVLARLLSQAFLFDDPRAYEAGVQDAWQALRPRPPRRSTAA